MGVLIRDVQRAPQPVSGELAGPPALVSRSRPPLAPSLAPALERVVRDRAIPELLSRRGAAPTQRPAVSRKAIEDLADIVAQHDPLMADVRATALIARVRARGVALEAIYLELLAGAARHLGVRWADDTLDFARVTLGTGRLRAAMERLGPEFRGDVPRRGAHCRVLLAPAPGEQHTFGMQMLAAFFERAGWSLGGLDPRRDPAAEVAGGWFAVAAFSIGGQERFDALAGLIRRVRRASCNPRLKIMVGGPLLFAAPDLLRALGADATTSDARLAVAQAELFASPGIG